MLWFVKMQIFLDEKHIEELPLAGRQQVLNLLSTSQHVALSSALAHTRFSFSDNMNNGLTAQATAHRYASQSL